MNPAQWERLKTLFHGALEQPAAARRAWLAREAGSDDEVLREAEALLEAHETAGGFLEQPAVVDLDEPLEPREPREPIAPGTVIGPYAVLEELGRGGMGVVYLAEDQRLRRRVALKVLPPAVAANSTLRERLRREAQAAATISHPCVAIVHALEDIDGQLLLVTEYIPGRTLREEIARGALAPARALDIALDIASALSAAHDAGVIHRDLKPENILITQGGAVKVVDFGIARVEGADAVRLTADGALLGTPAYMAPEQLVGARVDVRADIYSAGVVLAEMITGGRGRGEGGRWTAEGGGTASIRAPIAAIVARCLEPDPNARYGSARELAQAIEGSRTAPESAPRSTARWWWECHQGVVALVYWLMVIAAWTARGAIGGLAGRVFFILTLGAVIVAANLRLHLWFTSRFYPAELRWLRARVARWIHTADWVFAIALIGGSLLLGDGGSALSILLLSFGIGTAVAFLFMEPATTRAAFRTSSTAPTQPSPRN